MRPKFLPVLAISIILASAFAFYSAPASAQGVPDLPSVTVTCAQQKIPSTNSTTCDAIVTEYSLGVNGSISFSSCLDQYTTYTHKGETYTSVKCIDAGQVGSFSPPSCLAEQPWLTTSGCSVEYTPITQGNQSISATYQGSTTSWYQGSTTSWINFTMTVTPPEVITETVTSTSTVNRTLTQTSTQTSTSTETSISTAVRNVTTTSTQFSTLTQTSTVTATVATPSYVTQTSTTTAVQTMTKIEDLISLRDVAIFGIGILVVVAVLVATRKQAIIERRHPN